MCDVFLCPLCGLSPRTLQFKIFFVVYDDATAGICDLFRSRNVSSIPPNSE
jgi:hypothetical protein